MIVLDFLFRFLGAGVDYLPGEDRVRHLRKVPHIRGGIGIEHYDIGVHSLVHAAWADGSSWNKVIVSGGQPGKLPQLSHVAEFDHSKFQLLEVTT